MAKSRRDVPAVHSSESAGVPSFVVRPATPWDARSFHEMFRAVVAERRFLRSETAHGSVRHYRRSFGRSWTGDEASLVAVVGSRVVGHLNISREEHPVTRHVASL